MRKRKTGPSQWSDLTSTSLSDENAGQLSTARRQNCSAALFFRRVGCGWIAPLVDGSGDRARRLAQRLPRALGEVILRESQQALSEVERAALMRICASLPTTPGGL